MATKHIDFILGDFNEDFFSDGPIKISLQPLDCSQIISEATQIRGCCTQIRDCCRLNFY